MADFLFELGLEEIPARMIASAGAELGRRVTDLLTRERLLEPTVHGVAPKVNVKVTTGWRVPDGATKIG